MNVDVRGRLPGDLLHAASRLLTTFERNRIREICNMGVSDFQVLLRLDEGGTLTVSELGRKLLLSSGSVTTAIDRVERRGLVERRPDPADRRGVLVNLTEAGREVVGLRRPEIRDGVEAAFRDFRWPKGHSWLICCENWFPGSRDHNPSNPEAPKRQTPGHPPLASRGFAPPPAEAWFAHALAAHRR